jgi:hypothetical protein
MSQPGTKYFKGRAVQGERVLHYIVWDGVHDYERAPPLDAFAQIVPPGIQLHLKVDDGRGYSSFDPRAHELSSGKQPRNLDPRLQNLSASRAGTEKVGRRVAHLGAKVPTGCQPKGCTH